MTVSTDTPRVPLTATEAKVARLMSLGYDYDRIGDLLGIDGRTVEDHVYRIFAKLDNPDELTPKMRVTLWAAFQRWTEERRRDGNAA